MDYTDYLIKTCERFSGMGDVRLSNGARLLGRIPYGNRVDFHIVSDGLLPGEIEALELIIKQPLPPALKHFYSRINGGHFFAGEFAIFGLRRSFGRTLDDAAQPFAMETPNLFERPSGTPKDAVIFASYFDDDHCQLAAFLDSPKIVAFLGGRMPGRTIWEPRRTWPDLETCLVSEFDRLGKLFDSEGRRIDPEESSSPIV